MARRRRQPALRFTKMHGLGNDFVMLDLVSQRFDLQQRHIKRLADRRLGVGCDQVLVVEPPRRPDVDFHYRIFNADGSEVEQCGNGARCLARFVRDRQLTRKQQLLVETTGGLLELRVQDKQSVSVDMGAPRFEPADIPLQADARQPTYQLVPAEGKTLEFGALSMGNPHAVLRVQDTGSAAVARLGRVIQNSELFPQGVNVGFMSVQDETAIRLRVYERGVGETQACGSGACAAVAHGIMQGWLQAVVTVSLPGGKLTIEWQGEGHNVIMTGPTAVAFEGSIRL